MWLDMCLMFLFGIFILSTTLYMASKILDFINEKVDIMEGLQRGWDVKLRSSEDLSIREKAFLTKGQQDEIKGKKE